MAERRLKGLRVAVLAADGFEQVELTEPVNALREQGATIEIVSLRRGKIRGMNLHKPGCKVRVDRTVWTADPSMYDALMLPGGFIGSDVLRQSEAARAFVRAFDRTGKPVAVICHGPSLLVSAGLVRGRRLASWPAVADDISHAGGIWIDASVVRNDNWISSRGPQDLPAFISAMVELFATRVPQQQHMPPRALPAFRWLAAAMATMAAGGAAFRRVTA